jgi:hypothetical protein
LEDIARFVRQRKDQTVLGFTLGHPQQPSPPINVVQGKCPTTARRLRRWLVLACTATKPSIRFRVRLASAEAEKARAALGDALTKRPGAERREPGCLTEAKPRLSLGAAGAMR